MEQRSQRRYTLGEYFAVEEVSNVKHEYYDGEIFAMAGSSLRHNHITANVLTLSVPALEQATAAHSAAIFACKLRVGFLPIPMSW
jgi:Uma2 family endonuclease